eukprot:TRINITY_DN1557_c0_g1_i2.p1 TRINITY_DN1557_c0_g1~~TRINITY_DN1557_c0_g1_i2.p1  ORF type:complete len:136 (+),score=20.09 TRINITY_DN1557_c0_g1_i2:84-491(+)
MSLPGGLRVRLAALFLLPLGALAICHQVVPSGQWTQGLCLEHADPSNTNCKMLIKLKGWNMGRCKENGWDHVCRKETPRGTNEEWFKTEDCHGICWQSGGTLGEDEKPCPTDALHDAAGVKLEAKILTDNRVVYA